MYSFDIVKKNYVLVMITHESQRVKTKQQIKSEKFVRKLKKQSFSQLTFKTPFCDMPLVVPFWSISEQQPLTPLPQHSFHKDWN